jgi:hypothetical protein
MRRAFAVRHADAVTGWLILLVVLLSLLIIYLIARQGRHPPIGIGQRAQLNSINAALEFFNSEFNRYPPSDANDIAGSPYCGAMKLAEAVMGQDLLGFHRKSVFRADGLDPNTLAPLYTVDSLRVRGGPYLGPENANLFKLVDVYGKGKTGPFPENALVLCDTFTRKLPSGKKGGLPILYYRADLSGTKHDPNNPDDPKNIYDYRDNLALLQLGVPGDPNAVHPLADPRRFYLNTQSHQVTTGPGSYPPDSFILISAGYDGLYGTRDDIWNFDWRYQDR